MEELKDKYFLWMLDKLFCNKNLINSYWILLNQLNSIPFEWSIELDENRAKDGQDLRYIFADEEGFSESQVCQELDIIEPSLLEVIVALIYRVQENILYEFDNGITNQEIFLDILTSLRIDMLKGSEFWDEEGINYFLDVIEKFYSHNYGYNGEGSLFTVNMPKNDMRDTEIWFQFMWYLDEKLGGKYL